MPSETPYTCMLTANDDLCPLSHAALSLQTLCVCLSTIVVFETSVEYMLVMRELHHGHQSAWKLIKLFTPYRRVAEYCFAFDLPVFILSCAMMVHVRFATLTQSTTIATVAEVLLACTLALLLGMMMLMQRVKHVHGEGKKKEREKKRQREEQRKAAAALMAQPGGAEGSSLRAASKKRRSLGVFAGALGQSMGRKQMGRLISVLPGNNSNRSSMRDSDDEVTSSPSPSPEPQGTKAARGNRKGVGFSDQISDDGGVQLSERAQGGSECAPSRPDLVPVRRDSQVERLLAAHDAASHSLDSELGSMRESTGEEDSGGSNSQAV